MCSISFVRAEEPDLWPYLNYTDYERVYSSDDAPKEPGDYGDEFVIEDPSLGGSLEGLYNYFYSSTNLNTRNCYGFAIGQNAIVNPGYYCGINSSTYQYNYTYDSVNISNLCFAVINDLHQLGYIYAHEVSASYTPSNGETIIAFRLGYKYNNNSFADYHFMKKASGYWLHKPGNTAILRYKGYNLSSTWYPEAYIMNGGWAYDHSFSYKGGVKYVAY